MVNNISNNTINEISAKKSLNTLNEIKNAEIIKYKKRTSKHKKILNLFNDLLDIILTDRTSESQENENEKVESRKKENEKVESRKEENEKVKNENKDDYANEDYENEGDDETMDQNIKNEIIKGLNDYLEKIIDKSKLFEEQIELLKKIRRSKRVFSLYRFW